MPSPGVREVPASMDCAICGVTRAEILHGARTPEDARDLAAAMDAFIPLPIHQATWDYLGLHLASLRARGVPMPFQDVLPAAVAIDHDADLWSYDGRFRIIQDILTSLRLFEGPTG